MKLFKVFFGSFIAAMGIVIFIEADQGIDPLGVFYQGIINQTGEFLGVSTFGTISMTFGFSILMIAFLLDPKRIGIGSWIVSVFIGIFINLVYASGLYQLVPESALFNLFAGPIVIGIGATIHLSADLGAGPLEALMLTASERTKVGIKYVRMAIDASFVAVGLLLGATFGWGIISGVLLIGPTIEYTLKFLDKMKNRY